jgi:hypothetical protein
MGEIPGIQGKSYPGVPGGLPGRNHHRISLSINWEEDDMPSDRILMKPEPPPLQIAKPCPKQWDEMAGSAKKRFCGHCQLHVHNLSTMSDRERSAFVSETGGHACIAYEFRADGSMVTPSRWAWLTAPFSRVLRPITALIAVFVPFLSACTTRRTLGEPSPAKDVSGVQCKDRKPAPQMLLGSPMVQPKE